MGTGVERCSARHDGIRRVFLARLARVGWWGLRGLPGAVAITLWTACSDGPTAPELGAVRVAIVTTGGDLDEDGYVIVVGDDRRESVGGNAATTLRDIGSGTYSVALEGVADNCAVNGPNPRSVTISLDAIAQIEFVVACEATGIAITTVTSGPDVPPPYQVEVGALAPKPILANTTMLVSRLAPGTYTVALTAVAAGCTVNGDPQVTVAVTSLTVTPVTFSVTCGILTGVVNVTFTTSGTDRDPNGYTLVATGGWQSSAPASGVVTLQPMAPGTYVLQLSGVASNCTITNGSERIVTVTAGGDTRDTVNTEFAAACVRTEKIAYVQNGSIVVAYADGSNPIVVASGYGPSWSPDGRRLLYSALVCEYYGYFCTGGLEVVDTETGDVTAVINGGGGWDPAWSADGTSIAFVYAAPDGSRKVAVISAGVDLPPIFPVASGLLTNWAWPSSPSWSPDGQRIVFGCTVSASNTSDICAVNRNGTGFQRLTNEANNFSPAWSLDGSRIVFVTSRFTGNQAGSFELALMMPDGSAVTRLVPGFTPAWMPSGQILFASTGGVHVVNPDGSGFARLFIASVSDPAWRP